MRIRYLGPGPQWGDGGEFHGWQVMAPPALLPGAWRWRAPRTNEEHSAVRKAMGVSAEAFSGPRGLDVAGSE